MNLASFLWDRVGAEVNPGLVFDAATCWQRAADVDGWFLCCECAEGMGSGHSDAKINDFSGMDLGHQQNLCIMQLLPALQQI